VLSHIINYCIIVAITHWVSYKIEAVFSEAAKIAALAQYILHSSRTIIERISIPFILQEWILA